MQIILHTTPGQSAPTLTLLGDSLADPLQGIDGPYLLLDSEALPTEPREAWIVDWETGEITVDSNWAPPPFPNWVAFNAAILANPEWLATAATVRAINPDLIVALYVALSQVGGGQCESFRQLFATVMAMAEVAPAQRDAWATMAEGFNLPAEFVDIVRGD